MRRWIKSSKAMKHGLNLKIGVMDSCLEGKRQGSMCQSISDRDLSVCKETF